MKTLNKEFNEYIKKFDNLVQKYIPPKKDWTPPDDAIYGKKNLYCIPLKEAKELQFKAIKYQFKNQFENNKMYHGFCKEMNKSPSDIKKYEDLEKIPLVPSEFYKDYPSGKDFALWLANIFTGEIPQVKISGKNPSFDDVINSFNSTGLAVAYSSGTSGRHTFIPRDRRTFNVSEYAIAKLAITMAYPSWHHNSYGYLLMPNPFKTNVYAGKVCTIYFDVIKNVTSAIDREINTDLIKMSMVGGSGLKAKIIKSTLARMNKKIINKIIKWLEKNDKEKNRIVFAGAPFFLYAVTNKLKEQGKTFDFSDRSTILTGGGWKIHEAKRMPVDDFRKQMEEVLGVKPKHCLDGYGMVEGNGWMIHCPEGHYLHIPNSYFHPLVLDDEFKPVGYGEYGRFAFLDASTFSYPGFIISGDRVRMLEHCPVCDRPGPVLEPEVTRASGKEMRGCAEELRRMISADMGD
jgi:phenylacetate-coenzyme A ligase PaaK-like adenylate-forming protein